MANQDSSDITMNQLLDRRWFIFVLISIIVGSIYLGCVVSPPSLMDDVDAVQTQIARNMLTSHDWVTARIDGVLYLEKSRLIYWFIAILYKVLGVSDWVARLPVALSAIALALLTAAFGIWAFGKRASLYAGIVVGTCVGLFLFTRIQIPDVMLTFTNALAMWAFLRALDDKESHLRLWAAIFAASLGIGLLLKSLVALVFPLATIVIYLFLTKQLFLSRTWHRLRPITGLTIVSTIAVPWHVLGTLRNPPYFALDSQNWTGPVSRIFVVLFHQRTATSLFKHPLPARLQHGAPFIFLAVSPHLALSRECVSSGRVQTFIQTVRPGRADVPFGTLLDWLCSRVFHSFDDPGVLLHAVLSGSGLAAWLRHGFG